MCGFSVVAQGKKYSFNQWEMSNNQAVMFGITSNSDPATYIYRYIDIYNYTYVYD